MSAVYVLVAIGPKELHGYAIMSEIARITDGSVRLGPGTLYTSIKRLLESGLLEEVSERPDPEFDDQRRRYYRLTPVGSQRLEQMVRHWQSVQQTVQHLIQGEKS